MITNKILREVGTALFGPRYQSELARHLVVSERTVRRWVADEIRTPVTVLADLKGLVQERLAMLKMFATVIDDQAAKETQT